MADKLDSENFQNRIREILWCEWDPIGVNGIPNAIDEYDTYADTIWAKLQRQPVTESDIATYLLDIGIRHMGLPGRDCVAAVSDHAARLIIEARAEFSDD